MEVVKNLIQDKRYEEAIALQQGFLRATYQIMLTEDNNKETRSLTRISIENLKEKLEQEFGQSLFNEELDNKLHGE